MSNELPKPLLTALISKLSTITGIPAADLSQSTLYQLSDEVLVQYGKTDNREVYVYREGFYRGTFVSSFLVAISLLLRASCSSLALDLGSTAPIISQSILLLVAGLFLLFSFLFYGRYRRFAAYRVRAAILAALLSADRLPRSGGNVQ